MKRRTNRYVLFFSSLSLGLSLRGSGLAPLLSISVSPPFAIVRTLPQVVCWYFQIFDSAPLSRHHSSSSTSRGHTHISFVAHSHPHSTYTNSQTYCTHSPGTEQLSLTKCLSVSGTCCNQEGTDKRKRNTSTLTLTHTTQHFTCTLTHQHQ